MSGKVNQHKEMAMGKKVASKSAPVTKMKKGGAVKGLPSGPLVTAKRMNGIPKMKDGGKC